jgi:predicted nucleotidyltransferase
MGIKRSLANQDAIPPVGLGDSLFSQTQQRVLGLLFGQPSRSFFGNEVIAMTGSGSGAVQRELKRLTESGLVTSKWVGNQRHFQANSSSPIFSELAQIVQKTFGLTYPIREALEPLRGEIQFAFVFGSVAARRDVAASDIDLMVVSSRLTSADLIPVLLPVEAHLGRSINPMIYSPEEYREKLAQQNPFLIRVMEQDKLWIVGSEGD